MTPCSQLPPAAATLLPRAPSGIGALRCALALALVFALVTSVQAQSRQMYRYTNAEGNQVVDFQVPPEFVANGYEVLSSTGALLSVVPKQLEAGELEDLSTREAREQAAQDERERLRKWDESLLLRYSTIEDIEAARARALRDLRIRVSILKGKLRSLKQQVENYQAQAADQERLGNAIDGEHLEAIDDLRSEITVTERAVNDRQSEIASVDADYNRDVERFSSLLDIVEMRKKISSGERADG